MSLLLRNRRTHFALWMGLGVAAAVAGPAGCLFPSYTFDEAEPSGSGAGTSSGGGSMTGGGSGANTEDCTNGVDDDNDGLADCADPKCTEVSCVSAVPEGWTGYFALYNGAPAGDPGCPSTFPVPSYQGTDGITAAPATCTCSCSAPTWTPGCAPIESITLSTGDAACAADTNCTGSFQIPAGWDGTCYGQGYFPGGQLTCGPNAEMSCSVNTGDPCSVSVRASRIAATGTGSCQPQLAPVQRPDPSWDLLGVACGGAPTTGVGCNVGQTCMPKTADPYESGLCISKTGNNACPAGPFTQKHVYYGGVDDSRDCLNDCSCAPAANGSCPATVSLYSDPGANSCVTLVTSFPAGTCMNIAGNPTLAGRTVSTPGAPTGGTCPASGGTPNGTATPIEPTTICCIP
ncbi:hypothetical protein [Chondromyces apiculatus]|uniref:Uncharacterized protein n=1 Tax=Chondromyces apiculatus DSM 436 TaxID=1192034 RepID=A0A017T1U3_9BACT|nr:hypothetical protein [Chondromyces apiculatus]EYF02820.1 Hypothetical protein CAP_6555 [Chondromyces apiculatus DSM 436]